MGEPSATIDRHLEQCVSCFTKSNLWFDIELFNVICHLCDALVIALPEESDHHRMVAQVRDVAAKNCGRCGSWFDDEEYIPCP